MHPECAEAVRKAADQQLSTGGMCKFVRESAETEFIIGTETGILHRLKLENPGKRFYPVGELVCADMKKITLEKVATALREMRTRVSVPEDIARPARRAIEAMLAL